MTRPLACSREETLPKAKASRSLSTGLAVGISCLRADDGSWPFMAIPRLEHAVSMQIILVQEPQATVRHIQAFQE